LVPSLDDVKNGDVVRSIEKRRDKAVALEADVSDPAAVVA